MSMFWTKDPKKGFGAGVLFTPAPEDDSADEQNPSGTPPRPVKMRKGGKVSKVRGGGIEQRGKTRGRFV